MVLEFLDEFLFPLIRIQSISSAPEKKTKVEKAVAYALQNVGQMRKAA